MSEIQLHFDGDFALNHQVSIRTLGKTLSSLQSAVDRAYLDIEYGGVQKHSKVKGSEYRNTDFWVESPREGGYILKFNSPLTKSKEIINRISRAILPAYDLALEQGELETSRIVKQVLIRKTQIREKLVIPEEFDISKEIVPEQQTLHSYGDRSINKEVDQMVSIVRSKHSGNSTLELQLVSNDTTNFEFNLENSKRFHQVVANRVLGKQVIYQARVISLDNKNLNGKIFNFSSKKESKILFSDNSDFLKVYPYLKDKETYMHFIGCPLFEYGAFDKYAGDIYFIDLINR